MPPLPGRAEQVAALAGACRGAASGAGRLVLVTGEAGVGKTRLAQAAADEGAADGLATARGWCLDDAAAPPLWPWQRAARDVPGLADVLRAVDPADGDDAAPWRLAEAVAGVLATAGGLCLVLEDLHWADPPTLDLLRRLLPELAGAPVLVVATARHDGLDGSPLGRALPALLRDPSTVHLPVTGLDADAIREWLCADPATHDWAARADELVALTDGNPFYVRTVVAELPRPDADVAATLTERPTWRTVLVAPYRALPDGVRRTVATAAVMGERLAPGLLADALGLPVAEVSEQLAQAVTAGLLHFGVTGLAFHHALVRDAVVADLDPAALSRAHADVAAALERTGDPMLAGPAALHWSHVEGRDAVRRCRDLAAAAAPGQALAPERAVELARLALRSAQALGADDEERADRLLTLARFEWAAGMMREALATCALGLDLAEAAGRPDLAADLALVPQGIGSFDVAMVTGAMCRRALHLLPAGETVRRARLLALCAVAAAEAAVAARERPPSSDDMTTTEDAHELSAQALRTARASGDLQAELETVAARHFVLSYPQSIEERTALAARAVELGPSSSTSMGALWGHLWEADLAFQRGDVLGVEQVTADVDRVAVRRASPVARWHALRLRSALAVLGGDFDLARARALEARAIADRVGDISMIGMHHAFHVNLAVLRGDASDVLPTTLDILRFAPPIPLVRASVPVILALRGDVEGARAEFATLRDVPARMPLGPRWLGTVGQIAMTAVLLDDAEVAAACYRLLLPVAGWCGGDGGGSPFATGSGEYQLGRLAQCSGDRRLAAEHYERGIPVDDRIRARPYAALGRLGLAECLADDPARAHRLAAEAAAELRRLDLPGPLARAEKLLGSSGACAPRAPLTDRPGGLSERELEVARLVGEALTNQQIAERLFLSVRTVESHVRNALMKLGLTSRTQLAVWLRDG